MHPSVIIFLLVYIINIPFGYWRSGEPRFSRNWYLAIHIPVPAILVVRIYCDLGWTLQSYIIMISAFSLGQLSGKIMRNIIRKNSS